MDTHTHTHTHKLPLIGNCRLRSNHWACCTSMCVPSSTLAPCFTACSVVLVLCNPLPCSFLLKPACCTRSAPARPHFTLCLPRPPCVVGACAAPDQHLLSPASFSAPSILLSGHMLHQTAPAHPRLNSLCSVPPLPLLPQVCQPFTDSKFNFKKAYLKEVLIQFEPRSTCASLIHDNNSVTMNKDNEASYKPLLLDSAPASSSPNLVRTNTHTHTHTHTYVYAHILTRTPTCTKSTCMCFYLESACLRAHTQHTTHTHTHTHTHTQHTTQNTHKLQVLINVSPIEYGHVLLVPHALDSLPQAMTASTFMQALHFAREADNPYFRVGYNSLGAYATINHLHFQVRGEMPTTQHACVLTFAMHALAVRGCPPFRIPGCITGNGRVGCCPAAKPVQGLE
jgi:hypothetical protein